MTSWGRGAAGAPSPQEAPPHAGLRNPFSPTPNLPEVPALALADMEVPGASFTWHIHTGYVPTPTSSLTPGDSEAPSRGPSAPPSVNSTGCTLG